MKANQLHDLLQNSSIEDIVLSPKGLSFYSAGQWHGPDADPSCSEKPLVHLARRIADKASVCLGLTHPSVDAFVDFQGHHVFRAHVIISPMALDGPQITLRRVPRAEDFDLNDFTDEDKSAELLKHFSAKKSMLICGATGAGKSSLLSALLQLCEANERVVILEDSPEIPVPNPLSLKLLAKNDRYGFREGALWDLSHLVYESLRMRPDRIIVGECRGPEAYALAQALMTGHRGVLSTLHAGSPEEALERFQELARASERGKNLPQKNFWDVVVFLAQNCDGDRHVEKILVL